MSKVKVLGIDLAKNTFQLHGADAKGRKVFNKKVKREKLLEVINKIDKADNFFVAMEACGGAHHIGRTLMKEGYSAKLIAAQFVKPFVQSGKNDANDALAITEAAIRPKMKFVGIKTVEQQDIQSIHRIREGYVKRKTQLANEIRGLLLEHGITVSKGVRYLKKELPLIVDGDNNLSTSFREILWELYEDLNQCFKRVEYYDKKLRVIHDNNNACKRLSAIDGVGLIVATAIYAAVGDPKTFKNGRQFAAYLGLTPRQNSTGGKTKLLGISKRGDPYIRKNLVHGCRSVVNYSQSKEDSRSRWIQNKLPNKGYNKVSVALANKTARIVWAVLAKEEEYRRPA